MDTGLGDFQYIYIWEGSLRLWYIDQELNVFFDIYTMLAYYKTYISMVGM